MYAFMETYDLFPIEQKGCRKESYGCKDQLLINRMIIEDCKSKHRNLGMAWIDYRKAFDSVPHSYILKILDLFKISPVLINFLRINMSIWGTTLNLTHQNGKLKSKPIKINSGIFQRDSLSPLLFCLSLIPLSKELNRTRYGYNIQKRSINHLFYMDDLMLFAKDDNDPGGLLQTVKKFSDDSGMSFGLDKCTKATFKRGKLTRTTSVELDRNTVIKDLKQKEVHKYFGIDESNGIQHAAMRKSKKGVLPESTSNPEDGTQLCKLHRSNKYFGNTCCNV